MCNYGAVDSAGIIIKSGAKTKKTIRNYNDKGNKVEEYGYFYGDSLSYKKIYHYDKRGFMIEEDDYDYNYEYNYTDNDGNLGTTPYHVPEGFLSLKLFRRYDEKGNIIKEDRYSSAMLREPCGNCNMVEGDPIKYDDKGKMLKDTYGDNKFSLPYPDGTSRYNSTRSFDEKGKMIKDDLFVENGSTCRNTFKYDIRGNMIVKEWDFFNGNILKTSYKYDSKNNMIEEAENEGNGGFRTKTTYKYDEKANVIESSVYKSSDSISYTNLYKFSDSDSKGNWLKEVTFTNGNLKDFIKRELEYIKD